MSSCLDAEFFVGTNIMLRYKWIFLIFLLTNLEVSAQQDDYASALHALFAARQEIAALREVCGVEVPTQRSAIEKSYLAWRARQEKLLHELDRRLNRMLRGASKDDNEFKKNFARSEAALRYVRETKKAIFMGQPRADIDAFCNHYPKFLASAQSDLEQGFTDELKIIRLRKY